VPSATLARARAVAAGIAGGAAALAVAPLIGLGIGVLFPLHVGRWFARDVLDRHRREVERADTAQQQADHRARLDVN
jgi:hypothetical protein